MHVMRVVRVVRPVTCKATAVMKPAILLFFSLASLSAVAEEAEPLTFDDRVSLALAAEDDERFHPYPSQVFRDAARRLAATMRKCGTSSSRQNPKPFVLVADIHADGYPREVAVRPAHAAARCFAAGFSANRYLPPPDYPYRDGFPVTMRIGGGQ